MAKELEAGGLSIRAVSGLIGVPTDTLRTWERRYDLVRPGRDAAGRRSYSAAEVQRLRAIATLAERGERVAELSNLSDQELQERIGIHQLGDGRPSAQVRVAVVQPTGGRFLAGVTAEGDARVEVVSSADRPDALEATHPVDVLVVDADLLGEDPAATARSLTARVGAPQVVVRYHFLSREQRKRLSLPGVRLVQGPLDATRLRRVVVDHAREAMLPEPTTEKTPPMRFSTVQLEQLMNARPDLDCECPNHLASLVLSLRAFELYSRDCENRSEEDALLHATLAARTGEVRATLEALLAQVCAHDGIPL